VSASSTLGELQDQGLGVETGGVDRVDHFLDQSGRSICRPERLTLIFIAGTDGSAPASGAHHGRLLQHPAPQLDDQPAFARRRR